MINGIAGYIDYKNKKENAKEILEKMSGVENIEPSQEYSEMYSPTTVILKKGSIKYKIAFIGELYNGKQIEETLNNNNIELDTKFDSEKVIKLYYLFKEQCVNYLKGVFSFVIVDENNNTSFMARDHFGIKSLFYTVLDGTFIFSTDITKLFKYNGVRPVINKNSITEIFALSPARNLGSGVFKNIFEIKPGCYGIYNQAGFIETKYYEIANKEHLDKEDITIQKVHDLVKESTISQLDRVNATFLSGGIDSSILTAIAAKELSKCGKRLKTYSVDYIDNDKNFKSTDFQPARDNYYIDLVAKRYNTDHKYILLDTNDLIDNLKNSVISRGLPGMADVDSSLFALCRKVREEESVILSGEFADEIFGGYPWLYREDALNSGTFPWSISIDERQKLINKEFRKDIDIKEYLKNMYETETKKINLTDNLSDEEKKIRRLQYLTIYYFGETLIDRTDRMAGSTNLNVRVPFVESKLVDYVFNIPWNLKNYNNMEKGILREAFKEYLPEEIIQRKKSPFPKTYNPNYLNQIKAILTQILDDKSSKLHQIIDEDFVREIINTDGASFTRPWFGQLMTGPQLMAYLIQVNMWLEEYNIEIEI